MEVGLEEGLELGGVGGERGCRAHETQRGRSPQPCHFFEASRQCVCVSVLVAVWYGNKRRQRERRHTVNTHTHECRINNSLSLSPAKFAQATGSLQVKSFPKDKKKETRHTCTHTLHTNCTRPLSPFLGIPTLVHWTSW